MVQNCLSKGKLAYDILLIEWRYKRAIYILPILPSRDGELPLKVEHFLVWSKHRVKKPSMSVAST